MKKTTFTKMLALVIGVIIIVASLTVGFAAFADTPSYYNVDGKGVKSDVASTPYKIKPLDSIKNLDFEEGFAYWSGRDAGLEGSGDTGYNFASSTITLKDDTANNNKYLQARVEGIRFATVAGNKKVQTTMTIPMTAANASVGDSLAVIYDAKGNDALKFRPYVRQVILKSGLTYNETTGVATINASGGQSTPLTQRDTENATVTPAEFEVQTEVEGWKTYVLSSNSGKTISDPTTASFKETTAAVQSTIYLQLIIGYAKDVTEGQILDACIDNIKIAKVKDGVYTDLATNTVIYQPTQSGGNGNGGGNGGAATSKYPAYYGTEADGFSSVNSSYPVALKPYDTITNLDFTDGFIFWSGQKVESATNDTKVLASDNFQIKQEANGNKYLTLRDDGFAFSIRTTFFKVANAKVGDKVVLIYDAKGADATSLRPFLMQDGLRPVTYQEDTGLNTNTPHPTNAGQNWNASAGSPKTIVGTALAPSEFATNLAPAGWTTYVTISTTTITAPADITSSATDDIYLQVCVGRDEAAGNTFDAAIDNIRVAKVENGVYTDLATGAVIYDPNAPTGGSGSTGTGTGTGTGSSSGTSNATGDSILMLAALFFVSGAGVFGTAKALKNR